MCFCFPLIPASDFPSRAETSTMPQGEKWECEKMQETVQLAGLFFPQLLKERS